MRRTAIGLLATFLVPVACGNIDDQAVESTSRAVTTTANEVMKIGVMIADTAAGRSDFVAAVDLAISQLNKGMQDANAAIRFQAVTVPYTAANYTADNAQLPAIDLVNNQNVLGIVVDESFATADVNQLNYEPTPRINHQVPITCFQCSSHHIHSAEFYAGFTDPDLWIWRTFFRSNFEGAASARMVHNRVRGGDVNNDGFVKVVVYFDPEHDYAASNFYYYFDQLTTAPHSIKFLVRIGGNPDYDMTQVFDPGPDGHAPDVVVMMMDRRDGLPGLTAFKNYSAPSKPSLQLNDDLRRDAYLPTLTALGVPIEGSSVLRLNSSQSGNLFKTAFTGATGHLPEQTASYAYDAVVMQAGAIGWAWHFESEDIPLAVKGYFLQLVQPAGTVIRPRASDFKLAAQIINSDQGYINYEGASNPMDMDVYTQENYPDLVHWKLDKGKFVELESYGCNPDNEACFQR